MKNQTTTTATPNGPETLIAPKPLAEQVVSNEAKAYGRDGRSKKSAGDSLEHQSHADRRECRPQSDDASTEAHHDHAQGDQEALGANHVEKFAPGHLGQQARGSANTQNKADLFL
jgi:hypothetical protein